MTGPTDLETLISTIETAAKDAGAMIVQAVLAVEEGGGHSAVIEARSIASLIRHVKPRLVYVSHAPFDIDTELDLLSGDDDEVRDDPAKAKLIAKWESREGQDGRVMLGFMCDGVAHVAVEDADWLSEFETEAGLLIERLQS